MATMPETKTFFALVLFGCFISVFCGCPSGWERYQNSCFHISRDTASWAEAEKMCEIHGSFLATIEDTAENQFIKTILAPHRHMMVPQWSHKSLADSDEILF